MPYFCEEGGGIEGGEGVGGSGGEGEESVGVVLVRVDERVTACKLNDLAARVGGLAEGSEDDFEGGGVPFVPGVRTTKKPKSIWIFCQQVWASCWSVGPRGALWSLARTHIGQVCKTSLLGKEGTPSA